MTTPARKRPTPRIAEPPPDPSTRFLDWFNVNWIPLTKVVLFLLGVVIVVNEFFITKTKDPVAIASGGAFMGVVLTFGRNGNGNGK